MSNKNTGGPAFPVADPFAAHTPGTVKEAIRLAEGGVTLRDYFATEAMSALIGKYSNSGDVARIAYAHADAMLEARK